MNIGMLPDEAQHIAEILRRGVNLVVHQAASKLDGLLPRLGLDGVDLSEMCDHR